MGLSGKAILRKHVYAARSSLHPSSEPPLLDRLWRNVFVQASVGSKLAQNWQMKLRREAWRQKRGEVSPSWGSHVV